jgi:ubiquinone/menaquinone biosynthesis C-methylase UbiE
MPASDPHPADDPDAPADPGILDRFAPFYDLEYGTYDADLDFYRGCAAQAAPRRSPAAQVLELACGSGRVLLALAAAGHVCTGVDASPAMLALARARLAAADLPATLVAARMEALPPDLGPFDLVLCALNSFAYLPTQADQLATLVDVQARLRRGGLLVLDLSPVDAGGPYPAAGELVHQGAWDRPGGGRVLKFVSGVWDSADQQHHVHWIYDEEDPAGRVRRTTIPQTLRYTYRWEAQLLLERAGLRLAGIYGTYDLDPYSSDSPRLILVAQRP